MTKSQIRTETPTITQNENVAAIILNWRAPLMTIDAVEQVLRQSTPPQHVFVVDNGSADGSAEFLSHELAQYSRNVTILFNQDNLGFSGGCNTAIKLIIADNFDYCWLLNNDAKPEQSCLEQLIASGRVSPNIGAVGSRIIDPSKPGGDHYGSWLHPITMISHSLQDPEELEQHRFSWLTAASLLVSTPALKSIGIFDEQFFMYWEDADLNMRLRKAGYQLIAAPRARVSHTAGTSSNSMTTQRYVWHFQSHRIWILKHHPFPKIMLAWLRAKYLLKALIDLDVARIRTLLKT